jgi:hypothetical protein
METIASFLSVLIDITLLVLLIAVLKMIWSLKISTVIEMLQKIPQKETPARPAQENIPGSDKAMGILSWVIAIIP